nr:immunoglobulin heavy chain junction region [Macaca mulatta]MOV90823.1 immunoglobulin heavy chain junction region [Macaca mulatta]MOV91970.1 immunoglobulin heavy chain junction region [Macaca mulatta]
CARRRAGVPTETYDSW